MCSVLSLIAAATRLFDVRGLKTAHSQSLSYSYALRYKAELRRVQAEFRASAAADVAALKEALEAYKDQNDRLEVQKKLLLQQVRLASTWAA
jgi:hypothetical protein